MNYYDSQTCDNDYIGKIVLYNHDTGKYFQPKCKSYGCPKHGFIQAKRLEKGIFNWLKDQKIIRFWTFTVRSVPQLSIDEHNEYFKLAWHRFITELRRNKMLTKRERNLQYVKVYEHHKTGILHVHLFATEYVHYTKLQSLWNYALSKYFPANEKMGNVHIKTFKTPRNAARYVSKYVVKEARRKGARIRAWSKSGRVNIFEKRVAKGRWSVIRKSSLNYLLLVNDCPILVQNTPSITEFRLEKRPKVEHPRLFKEHFDYFNQCYSFILPNN